MSLTDELKEKLLSKPVGITSAIALLYISYHIISDIKDKQKFRGIPTPGNSYPIVGHALSLGDLPGRQVYKWHEETNSPIIRLKMGVQNWVLISDPLIAHKVMVVHGKSASDRPYSTFGKVYFGKGGKGIAFADQGEVWRKSRDALYSILSPKNVSLYNDFIESEASALVEHLVDETQREGSVDPRKNIVLNTMNVICHVSVGKKFESTEDPIYKQIMFMVEQGLYFTGFAFDLPNFFPFLSIFYKNFGIEKQMSDFIDNVRDPLMTKLIREAKINKDAPNIIRSIEEEFGLDDEEQNMILLNDVIDAGVDPIKHAVRWSFALLCHFPDVQNQLYEEIQAFKKEYGRLPTFNDKDRVPFVHSALTECIRFRAPTTFGIPHLVTEDINVDGYCIPKGTSILSSYDHMQLSPHFIKGGDKLDFKRYMGTKGTLLSNTKGRIDNRDLFTFGWGKRSCPGVHLSNVQLFAIFVNLFSKCSIEPRIDNDGKLIYPDYESGIDTGVSTGVIPYKVRFVMRSNL